MDKPTKRDTAFCERDALADMRQAEREVLRAYAAAASEGGSLRLRTMLAENFAAAAEDLYAIDCALARGTEARAFASEGETKRVYAEFHRRGADLPEQG